EERVSIRQGTTQIDLPLAPGAHMDTFADAAINDAGQVAYSARYSARFYDGSAIFTGDGKLIAGSETPTDLIEAYTEGASLSIGSAGQIAYTVKAANSMNAE